MEELNVDQLKLRPIIDQTGTYIYNTRKVIAKHLKPLSKSEFTIIDTLTFPDLVKNASNSNECEEVSYDVGALFTSKPVEETINYIVDRIYVRKSKLNLCAKSRYLKIFLFKSAKGCVFSATEKWLKQVDSCPMGGPIYVVFKIYSCEKWN